MFIEKHDDTVTYSKTVNDNKTLPLAFIRSANVQAFPCGRRRSELIEVDTNGDGEIDAAGEGYRIPFDPEARLNTEANNRKHSSLNGYTQTYLKEWNKATGKLSLSLAGYLFNIDSVYKNDNSTGTTDDDYYDISIFGTALEELLTAKVNNAAYLYANIVIEDTPLYKGFQDYCTGVLRNQSDTSEKPPRDSIDLIKAGVAETDLPSREDFSNYYFAGLSFSTEAITDSTDTRSEKVVTFSRSDSVVKQTLVSLCILEKVDTTWQIHQPAFLPKVEHGTVEDSIVVGDTLVNGNITATGNLTLSGEAANGNGNITVTGKISAPELEATRTATIKDLTVDETATLKKLAVNTEFEAIPEDNSDVLYINGSSTITDGITTRIVTADSVETLEATITNTLKVQKNPTEELPAEALIDKAIIDNATVNGTITATAELTDTENEPINNLTVNRAQITRAQITALEADTLTVEGEGKVIKASDLQQKIGETYQTVPVIFVKKDSTTDTYQLQISRAVVEN